MRTIFPACFCTLLLLVTADAKPRRMLWDCDSLAGTKGLAIERENVKQGQGAVRWQDHPRTRGFHVPNVPKDWTGYNLLRIWIHSARAVPARVMIIIDSENPRTDGSDYWGYGVPLDFTGWKEMVFPIGGKDGTRSPRGWDEIDSVRFVASGWGNTPHSEADIFIDDIRLEYDPPRPGPRMTDAEFFQNLDLLRPELGHVREAVDAGDLEKAKTAFLAHMRSRTRPKWWLNWRDRPDITPIPEGGGDGRDYVVTLTADSEPPSFSAADTVLKHMYWGHHLGDDIDWTSNRRDPADPAFTKEWTYDLNRFRLWQTLGRAYWQSGDEKYAREWIAQMRDWVEDNPYLLYGTGNNTLTWRTIEAGIRCSGAWPDSLAYFLGSPSLEPDDLVVFMKSWIEHAHHLMRITLEHPNHGGNWVTMECNGLGHLGVLLPECRDAAVWLKTAADRLTLELDRQVYPDGAQKELSTGYHQVARRNFVDLYRLAQHNGVSMSEEYLTRLERLYTYNLQAMTPDGCLPPLNDAGYTRVLDSLAEGFELFGREDFRWGATRGTEGEAPPYTSVALPYAGQYVMRSGWESDDLYMLFESGPFGIGHQHEDKLSMFVYGLGRVLLTEAGTYSYDQSAYRRYVLGTWAHNTILVDGMEQHRRDLRGTYETDEPLTNLWITTDRFDAADGVYASGYGRKRDTSVTHERAVVFIRPDYWVVVDWLHADGEHAYDILWHLNNDNASHNRESLAAWGADPGVANLVVTPVCAAGLSLEIVKGRHDPVLGFAPAKRKKPIPVLNYKLQAKGPVRLAWVLTPFKGDRPDVSITTEDRSGCALVIANGKRTDKVHIYPRSSGKPPAERILVAPTFSR